MKLTIIGGGGVRTPLLVKSILRRSPHFILNELSLLDINSDKLYIIGALVKELLQQSNSKIKLTTTTNPESALQGANYIITTIRVGGDEGRILDERIALKHGVLGQETTGPGGFAMALRSIPAILYYVELIKRICPKAWVFNFTNPAGLVTQAIRDSGFNNIVGICDGANLGQINAAAWLNLNPNDLRAEVYGLNHLSWTRAINYNNQDILPDLLRNDAFLKNSNQNLFSPDLVRQIRMFLNEYLYYYYYSQEALRQINSKQETRGEKIAGINRRMLSEIKNILHNHNPEAALDTYFAFNDQRVESYMDFSRFSDQGNTPAASIGIIKDRFRELEEDGYAGVALNLIQSFESNTPLYSALNVPNETSITGMDPKDVVEVSCRVDGNGITPLPIGYIPEAHIALMKLVKFYEKKTVEAIIIKSRKLAVEALMYHPLVLSYPLACELVDEYLSAHSKYIGAWDQT